LLKPNQRRDHFPEARSPAGLHGRRQSDTSRRNCSTSAQSACIGHSIRSRKVCAAALFRHEGRNLVATDAAQVLADVARDVLKLMSDGINCHPGRRAAIRLISSRSGRFIRSTIKTVPTLIIGMKLRKTYFADRAHAWLQRRPPAKDQAGARPMRPSWPFRKARPDIESIPLFQDDIFFAAPAGSKYADLEGR